MHHARMISVLVTIRALIPLVVFNLLLPGAANALTTLTDDNINSAARDWVSDPVQARQTYGEISDWDTSRVTSLYETFYKASSFSQ